MLPYMDLARPKEESVYRIFKSGTADVSVAAYETEVHLKVGAP